MAKICLCLTAKTIERNLEIVRKYQQDIDIAELRVDCLDPNDRLFIRRFPELAGLPVILTIRRDVDGGYFTGGEGARVKLMALGLSYAKADTRLNFAYVDIEDDFDVPSLEEAARTFGTRIIRSYHNLNGVIDDIPAKIKSMKRSDDELTKIAVTVNSTKDVLDVLRAAKTSANKNTILVCMGRHGVFTRVLAEKLGSFLSYSSALDESGIAGIPYQLNIRDMTELYRFRRITEKTKIFGIAGYPLKTSISPWFFNTIFQLENTDAVYVPFPVDSAEDILELAKELDVQGLSVTTPYKEAVIDAVDKCSIEVVSVGASNTIYRSGDGWFADNTDSRSFSGSLLKFINKRNLKRKKITIVGAGGAARSVAAEIFRLGGRALILNRTAHKARNLALNYNFQWGGLDNRGAALMSKYNDIIIQASSAGMEGNAALDPFELYLFNGNEVVMDLIYTPAITPFLKRAAAAGCKTMNGYDMVIRQACFQYNCFMKKEVPQQLFSRITKLGKEETQRKVHIYGTVDSGPAER